MQQPELGEAMNSVPKAYAQFIKMAYQAALHDLAKSVERGERVDWAFEAYMERSRNVHENRLIHGDIEGIDS
jgi:HD superfamily phosphohydrolase YqeK